MMCECQDCLRRQSAMRFEDRCVTPVAVELEPGVEGLADCRRCSGCQRKLSRILLLRGYTGRFSGGMRNDVLQTPDCVAQ